MSQYQSIVLVADPDLRDSDALNRAVLLAQLSGARLHVLMVSYDAGITALAAISGELMELAKQKHLHKRQQWLLERQSELKTALGPCEVELHWSRPQHETLIRRIAELGPDLVVKDVRHEPLLKRLLFTPQDWQLLRLCPAPLLLVREGSTAIRRVAVTVDPLRAGHEAAPLQDAVVQAAHHLALQASAELHLVHAFEGLMPIAPAEMHSAATITAFASAREFHHQRFQAFADRLQAPADRRHFLDGPADAAVADLTRRLEIDVLAVGTIHRTGLDRVIMGSTAERILEAVACDVLAVKPEGFKADLQKYLKLS